jgi:GNAT superfamily N-acetyltransferase
MVEPALRVTTEDDEEFLWEMLFYASHSYEEPGVELGDIRGNPDLTPYIEGWRAGGRFGVIAEMEDKVGASWLRVMSERDAGKPWFLDASTPELAIAVRPGLEGRGIGSAMLDELLMTAKERFPGIVLSAREGNPAVRLYERHGFETRGVMTNRVGTRSVMMAIVFHRSGA